MDEHRVGMVIDGDRVVAIKRDGETKSSQEDRSKGHPSDDSHAGEIPGGPARS